MSGTKEHYIHQLKVEVELEWQASVFCLESLGHRISVILIVLIRRFRIESSLEKESFLFKWHFPNF